MYIIGAFFVLIPLLIFPAFENENTDVDILYKKSLDSSTNLKFNDTLFYLDEILKQEPDNTLILYNKGVILTHLEQYGESLQYFEKAIKIDPDFYEAINGKDVALTKLNQKVNGISMFFDPDVIDKFMNEQHMIDPNSFTNLKYLQILSSSFVREMGFATIEVRNSDNQLVGYTESHDIWFQYPAAWMILESQTEWTPIDIDGKKMKMLEYSINIASSESTSTSQTHMLLLKEDTMGFNSIVINHNGILNESGDRLDVKIILLRSD